MKVKRFNNKWIMGLILCGAILIVLYIAKLIFPSFVVETAQNERICNLGRYIDTHKVVWYIVSMILSFTVYYLQCCACARKKRLSLKENLYIVIGVIILYLSKLILPDYFTTLNYILMIALPCVMKAKLFPTTIVFSSINILQIFTLEIRSIKTMITDYNFATLFILLIDVYIFQVLLYFGFNYKKGE